MYWLSYCKAIRILHTDAHATQNLNVEPQPSSRFESSSIVRVASTTTHQRSLLEMDQKSEVNCQSSSSCITGATPVAAVKPTKPNPALSSAACIVSSSETTGSGI